MDLAVLYAGGRYTALLDYIDMLPGACRLNEAIANDPLLAEIMAAQPEPDEPWTPRVQDFNLTNMLLAQLVDGLKALQSTQVAVGGGKPSKIEPFPRPRTAVDRAKEAKEKQFVGDVLGLFGFGLGDF